MSPATGPEAHAENAMAAALDAAREAAAAGDVPVGAAVFTIETGTLVAVAGNERELRSDPTAHAEMLAIRAASQILGTWHLDGCAVAVTLEPCTMCAGALVAARVRHLYYGADDPKAGACGSLYQVCDDPRLNHRVEVSWGVRGPECAELLTAFFAERRRDGA